MLSDILFRVRSLFRRKIAEAELEDELRFHRERELDKYVSAGLTDVEGLRRVRLYFGGVQQVKEECREAWGVRAFETLLWDLRYGWRVLRKSPGFTAVALVTLTLGIGANTAIFSVLYGILLRPLPYKDATNLIVLNEATPKVGMVSVSYPDFVDWQIELAVSDAILDEMGHVLARPKFAWAPQRIRQAQELLRDIAHHVAPQERLDVVTADPSDNRILECAQTSRSDVIITGDKHLLRLKSHTGIPIIRVSDFLSSARER